MIAGLVASGALGALGAASEVQACDVMTPSAPPEVSRMRGACPPALATTWSALEPMGLARQEVGVARVGDSLYVAGGIVDPYPPVTATATAEAYDLRTGEWSSLPDLPHFIHHPAMAALDGRVYVIGGFGPGGSRDDVWTWAPGELSWTAGTALPAPRAAGWAVELGGKIYLFGGVDAAFDATASTFIYDPGTGQWSPGADMATAREHLAAVAVGSYIHVLGGRDFLTPTDTHERYDPQTDTWEPMPSLPSARSAMGAAALGGRVHVLGGEFPSLSAAHEIYDPQRKTWTCAADVPVARHGAPAIAVGAEILWIAGGLTQAAVDPTSAVATVTTGLVFADGFELGDTSLWEPR